MTFVPQDGVNHDGGKEPERGKPDCREIWEWPFDAHLRELVRGERTEIPNEPQHRCREEERIEPRLEARCPTRADDHREQHRVEHDAGAQPHEIQQLADVQSVRHATPIPKSA